MEPRTVSAVGIAVGRPSERDERSAAVQDAMTVAVQKAMADGVRDRDELTRIALAARDGAR